MSAFYKQLCTAVEHTAVGVLLLAVNMTEIEYFHERYIHDFVRYAHRCNHKNQGEEDHEYEVKLM